MTLHTATAPTGRPVVVPAGMEVLRPFIEAGVFGEYEVQFAAGVLRLQPGLGDDELLALAVAARAPRFGHVCTHSMPWPSTWPSSTGRSRTTCPGRRQMSGRPACRGPASCPG